MAQRNPCDAYQLISPTRTPIRGSTYGMFKTVALLDRHHTRIDQSGHPTVAQWAMIGDVGNIVGRGVGTVGVVQVS